MSVSKRLKRVVCDPVVKQEEPRPRRIARRKQQRESDQPDSVPCNFAEIDDISVIIALTKHEDPRIRVRALREMCPCRVWEDIDAFWDRIFEMAQEETDTGVRKQVLHTLCDGSPAHREHDVINAVEAFNRDPDRDTRRIAHKVIGSYSRTGNWNIL